MSTIPPNWLGSIIQTQGAHAREAADKSKEAGAAAEQTDASFAERLGEIEATDRDSQVYSDAEGTGSQGRPFEDQPPEEEAADAEAGEDEPGTPGANTPGAGGLDVQA